jgi:GT2 family glycosyltransferase
MNGGRPETTSETRLVDTAPVAVVVVSWNAANYLPGCLESLDGLERPPAEVVVVDSGSGDGSPELVRARYPDVELIDCGENVGFCRGNNIGIRATSSPFVLVLNPDTLLERGFLEQLLPAFEDPRVGMVAGKLLRFDRETVDTAGQLLSRSRRPRDRGYGEIDRGRFDRDDEVFGVCGAAALYRREMLDSIVDPGGQYFDEAFFAFGEDLDLAWRAQRMGWSAAYRYRSVGYHARGGSSGGPAWSRRRGALLGRSAVIRYHVLKNRYLTILRNDTVAGYVANLPFIVGRDLALLGLVLFTSPGILGRLWAERAVFRGALEKRRLDAARGGHHFKEGEPT